jgi:hypothetical protein
VGQALLVAVVPTVALVDAVVGVALAFEVVLLPLQAARVPASVAKKRRVQTR